MGDLFIKKSAMKSQFLLREKVFPDAPSARRQLLVSLSDLGGLGVRGDPGGDPDGDECREPASTRRRPFRFPPCSISALCFSCSFFATSWRFLSMEEMPPGVIALKPDAAVGGDDVSETDDCRLACPRRPSLLDACSGLVRLSLKEDADVLLIFLRSFLLCDSLESAGEVCLEGSVSCCEGLELAVSCCKGLELASEVVESPPPGGDVESPLCAINLLRRPAMPEEAGCGPSVSMGSSVVCLNMTCFFANSTFGEVVLPSCPTRASADAASQFSDRSESLSLSESSSSDAARSWSNSASRSRSSLDPSSDSAAASTWVSCSPAPKLSRICLRNRLLRLTLLTHGTAARR